MRDSFKKILVVFIMLFCCQMNAFCQHDQNYLLAQQYFQEGKYTEAQNLLEDLISKDFKNEYYQLLLNIYTHNENNKASEKLIKKAIKKSHAAYNYLIDLGLFYQTNNQQSKADKTFASVINKLKANNTQIIQTANYFSSNQLYEQAIEVYLKAQELFHDQTKYTYELSYLYQTLSRREDIVKQYLLLLSTNPQMLNQIEVNLNSLFNRDKDTVLQAMVYQSVLHYLQTNPENLSFNLLYYWLIMQSKDFATALSQAKAIDRRFNQDYEQTYQFAIECENLEQYHFAEQAYDYILKESSSSEKTCDITQRKLSCLYKSFLSHANKTKKDAQNLQEQYESLFSLCTMNVSSAQSMKEYAYILAYFLNAPQTSADILDSLIHLPLNSRFKAECKLQLADLLLFSGDIWQASLTYSQVEKDFKNETIGSQAKFLNAMLSYYTSDFAWALSQFDVLRSSTTKLIANDAMEYSLLIKENIDPDSSYKGLSWYAKADLLFYQNKNKEAEMYLDSIENYFSYHPLFDEILYKRALIAIKEKEYNKADSLLNLLLEKYPYDLTADDALFRLALLYKDFLNQNDKAKSCFEKLLLDYPSSLYVPLARKEYEKYEK